MKARGRSHGLTLIEVMLAVVIIAGGLTVLLTGAARCLTAVKQAQYYQEAQWTLAKGETEHPLLHTNDLEALEVDDVDYENGFTFSRRVADIEEENEDGLFEIRTRVTWSVRGQAAFEEVVRLMYIPEAIEESAGSGLETEGANAERGTRNAEPATGEGSTEGGAPLGAPEK
jgi:prepilin-type N-terminal cleavage/methylation domain-containing protein